MKFEILIAEKHGMCSGVKRALALVRTAIKEHPETPVCVYNEIVHNDFVINELKQAGVRFVQTIQEVPVQAVLIFSAHGVSPAIEAEAHQRGLQVIDASCLLVKKNHRILENCSANHETVIFIGHCSHPEVAGALGRIKSKYFLIESEADVKNLPEISGEVSLLSQTTLSQEFTDKIAKKLQLKYPQLKNYGGICYATCERQNAMRKMCRKQLDLVLVAGSQKSSNSRQLCKIAEGCGVEAHLIENESDLPKLIKPNCQRIGLSSGASTPEQEFNKILTALQKMQKNQD